MTDYARLIEIAEAVEADPNHHAKFEAFRAAFRPVQVLSLLRDLSRCREALERIRALPENRPADSNSRGGTYCDGVSAGHVDAAYLAASALNPEAK